MRVSPVSETRNIYNDKNQNQNHNQNQSKKRNKNIKEKNEKFSLVERKIEKDI